MPRDKFALNVVVIGHGDSGKSTLAGHLMHLCGSVTRDVIQEFEEEGDSSSRYAWVVDKTKEERDEGITMDATISRLETPKYHITMINTPGDSDYIENVAIGAAMADCALLVVSADQNEFNDGLPRVREHALLAFSLGIRQVIVAVNKMDLCGWDQWQFNGVSGETSALLRKIGFNTRTIPFIPTSGFEGESLLESRKLPWFNGFTRELLWGSKMLHVVKGRTILDAIDTIEVPARPTDKPLRLIIHSVHDIDGVGTVPVGCVQTGTLSPGMSVTFAPSGMTAEVLSIERHHEVLEEGMAGDIVSFSIGDDGPVSRGHVVSDPDNDPATGCKSFDVQLLVIGPQCQISSGDTATVFCHAANVECTLEPLRKIDRRTGKTVEDNPSSLKQGDAGVIKMTPSESICVEVYSDYPTLGRVVVRGSDKTIAVGRVVDVETD